MAVLALNAVARAHEAPSQPQAVFAAVDHALAGEIGHRLFTILSYDRTAAWPRGCIRTCPTPTRGRQQDRDAGAVDRHGAGARRVLHRLHAGRSAQRLRRSRIDRLAGLPERAERADPLARPHLGSLNLLHAERWYGPDDAIACRPYAQLVLPALCCA